MIVYDCVVIGSGSGGALAFYELTKLGKSVLLIEEGIYDSTLVNSTKNVSLLNRALYRSGGLRPAIGLPSITIGEGVAVGGSTEVNGGLFWRLPTHTIRAWEKSHAQVDLAQIMESFDYIEDLLGVMYEPMIDSGNIDSKLLSDGARNLGWRVSPARRIVKGCQRHNMCASGCPSGAKQSMSRSLIPKAKIAGGEILTGHKVTKIIVSSSEKVKIESKSLGHLYSHFAKEVVVSCGAIETPRLLMKSNLIERSITRISYHANLKIIAEFEEKVNARNGTIFTSQVQEFIDEGILFMAANLNQSYLAMASSGISNSLFTQLLQKIDHLGLYTCQIQTGGGLYDYPIMRSGNVLRAKLSDEDCLRIKRGLLLNCTALFSSGAVSLLLPIKGSKPVYNLNSAKDLIETSELRTFTITTVHIMGSLPLSHSNQIINPKSGQLKLTNKVRILDASILPTNIGESPQGTIMALVYNLLK